MKMKLKKRKSPEGRGAAVMINAMTDAVLNAVIRLRDSGLTGAELKAEIRAAEGLARLLKRSAEELVRGKT